MKMVSNLPAVRQLIEHEKQKNIDLSVKARTECIGQLKTLRVKERALEQKRETAMAEVMKVAEDLHRVKLALGLADQAVIAANRERQNVENALSNTHGECYVTKCLYHLGDLLNKCREQIESTNHQRYINVVAGDYVVARRDNPAFGSLFAERQAKLNAVERCIVEAQKLVECDLAPSALMERCADLLLVAGYNKPSTIEGNAETSQPIVIA